MLDQMPFGAITLAAALCLSVVGALAQARPAPDAAGPMPPNIRIGPASGAGPRAAPTAMIPASLPAAPSRRR